RSRETTRASRFRRSQRNKLAKRHELQIPPRWLPPFRGTCSDGGTGTKGEAMKLKDQVAIVTGAGRNIGEEIARLFAAEGAKVAIVHLDKPRGERVAAAIRQAGGEAQLFAADVSRGSDVAALVKAVVHRLRRADILLNNDWHL